MRGRECEDREERHKEATEGGRNEYRSGREKACSSPGYSAKVFACGKSVYPQMSSY